MHKFTLLIFSLLSAFFVSAQPTTVFSCDFNSQEEFDKWTTLNLNEDSYTWAYYLNSDRGTASIRWNSSLASNDWLISPAFTVPEDGVFLFTMVYKGGGATAHEKMDIFIGTSPTVEGMTQVVSKMDDINGDGYKTYKALIKIKAGQPLYLGFHARSDADQWRILIDDVKITSSSGNDIALTNFISPVTGSNLSNAEEVKVRVANNGIAAISNFNIAYSIDGADPVEETFSGSIAAGESSEYTFTKKADISTVRTSYKFKAWVAMDLDEIAENDTITASVYNDGAATVPYSVTFEADESHDAFKFYNLNEDTGNWSVSIETGWFNMARTGNGCLMYDYDKNNPGDDWAILDGVSVEPGYYSLKFWYSSLNNHNERFAVFYGNGNTPADMTNKIVEYNPYNSDDYIESANVIYIAEKQVIYLGFHSFSDRDENAILIDDITLNKIDPSTIDLAVADITLPETFVRVQSKKDIAFGVTNKGITKVENATLKASLDGKEILNETVEIDAQATISRTVVDAIAGLAEGKHELKIEITKDGDSNVEDNVSIREFIVLGTPIKFWDFENYKTVNGEKVFYRPEDLTYLNRDGGTINSSLTRYFPDDLGWAPIELETHETLGDCMLGVTSYIDGVKNADRWCIFPQMRITDDNSYFIWSANSMDPSFLETYKIMISDSSADPDWFSTVATITNESAASKTRGIDLSSYKGKDIYVAIRLISKNSFILTLDNIGFYGNAQYTGVSGINSASESRLVYSAGTIAGSEDVESIELFDLSGRKILSQESNTADVSNINPGIYIAVGKTAVGQIKEKFVIK